MTVYDKLVCGMHDLRVTQAGKLDVGGNPLSHNLHELDLAGEDGGIDYWKNLMPNTWWKIAVKWGNSGTVLFHSCDKEGKPKKVVFADGSIDYATLALTHSNANYTVGTLVGYMQVMYQEGTKNAYGNHIHMEISRGHVLEKVVDPTGQYYILACMVDPRKAMWILDGYTKVVADMGLNFKHCTKNDLSITVDESPKKTGEATPMGVYFETWGASCVLRDRKGDSKEKNGQYGKYICTIPKGSLVPVMGFEQGDRNYGKPYDNNKANTQRIRVDYGGREGYVQADMSVYRLHSE